MTSDDALRASDLAFKFRSPGMWPLFKCARCAQPKSSAGRRLLKVGGLRQWVCQGCVAVGAREQGV